eukprot:CAMPEP_0118850484 /NCGR_PEP_ID=MMETSP1163-20130328/312_1 /TAXON_ID=124430 /ORGANISM="Phaeomonas parva, Strain CCMP2877" /LENGTH=398 /DNA_ID=CAMNT_0006782695 /DNA_START=193 /DNA_END=1389 /DNA_ORIENTATION=+
MAGNYGRDGTASIPVATAVVVPPSAPPPDRLSHGSASSAPPMTRQLSFTEPELHSRFAGGPMMTPEARQLLQEHRFPAGLVATIERAIQVYSFRYFILDNSGSMSAGDGSKVVNNRPRTCSRWSELGEAMRFHGELLHRLGAPGEFRMLNPPAGVGVGGPMQYIQVGNEAGGDEANVLLFQALETSPNGRTPLVQQVQQVRDQIAGHVDALQARGKRVAIIITTDGKPTDMGQSDSANASALRNAMNQLTGYPVNLVLRLCTDEEDVVDFFNDFDSLVEVPLDVLDDLHGEAKEVTEHQPWLNYGIPLHLTREFGVDDKIFDLLDERPLHLEEMARFLTMIFGERLPDVYDWKPFLTAVKAVNERTQPVYNPMTGKVQPWVNLRRLNQVYGKGSCVIS